MTQKQKSNQSIASNRRASHEFSFEERFEAGIALEGWEVKSLRAGKVQIDQAYVLLKKRRSVAIWRLNYALGDCLDP